MKSYRPITITDQGRELQIGGVEGAEEAPEAGKALPAGVQGRK